MHVPMASKTWILALACVQIDLRTLGEHLVLLQRKLFGFKHWKDLLARLNGGCSS
jgi:hypothetical protein